MISSALLRALTVLRLYPSRYLVLGKSAVAVTFVTAVTTEEVYATIPIPAGAIGLNGTLRVTVLWSYTNSGNTKTMRHRLGGAAGTVIAQTSATTTTQYQFQSTTANRGLANSQITTTLFVPFAGAATASTVDTSVAQDLVISGIKALGSETLTLESYLVELIR